MSRGSLSPSPVPCAPSCTGASSSATSSGAITPPCVSTPSYAGSPMVVDPDVWYTPIPRDDSPYSWRGSPGSPTRSPVTPVRHTPLVNPPMRPSPPPVKSCNSTPKAIPLLDRITPRVPLLPLTEGHEPATRRLAPKRDGGRAPVVPKSEVLAEAPQGETPTALRTRTGRRRERFAPYTRKSQKTKATKQHTSSTSWIPSSAYGATFDRKRNFRGTTANVEYQPAPYAPSFATYETGLPLEFRLSPPHTLPIRPLKGRQVLVGPVLYWAPATVISLFQRVGPVETVEPRLRGQFALLTFVDFVAERAAQMYNNVSIDNGPRLSVVVL